MANLFRSLGGGRSIERKCLFYFSLALLSSIFLAFWCIQQVAAYLVMGTTQQAARDFANATLGWEHTMAMNFGQGAGQPGKAVGNPVAGSPMGMNEIQLLRKYLANEDYQADILMLEPTSTFDLPDAKTPETDTERALLASLEQAYRQRLRQIFEANRLEASDPVVSETVAASRVRLRNQNYEPVFAEAGPVDGFYTYYHPVFFHEPACRDCHGKLPSAEAASLSEEMAAEFTPEEEDAKLAAESPFRVVRVRIPYQATRVATTSTLSVMIAMGMLTVAVTLLVLHYILKRLVIRPLAYLRDMSDEISRGNSNLRADIDTDDEFHELGEAFNRMLRHLTETQEQLKSLNSALDLKVDQLAQVNLQLYEANRLKSDFLANMSHELRTPLNSIIGFSEVLQGFDTLNDRQKRYAGNIQQSGRVLLEMINDILDLAKVEAGKMEVRPSSFNLAQVIDAQCDTVRSLSEEKNIDLQLQVNEDVGTVYQDQAKLQQILTNLLSNAIKFTPEGGLVTVAASRVDDHRFMFSVTDTGVGIAEEDFEVIFEKFRQSNAVVKGDGLTREFSGTGLGLSIVRELCKLLGGEISFTSQLGQGSSFMVVLPSHFTPPAPSEESSNESSMAGRVD